MAELRSVLIELLSQLGSSREAREYLKRFSSVDSYQFAVVKVGGGVLADNLPQLVSALAFLRHVGLLPIVLHGAGPQLNKALEEAGIQPDIVDGMRVTTPDVMAVARPVIYEQNLKLVEALEAEGVRARSLMHGVFDAVYLDPEKYGLVGDVLKVRNEALKATVDAGAMPIVACLGESRSGQVLNINADVAARSLVLAVEPFKVIFLTPTGGLLDDQERVISAINLATDYDSLMAAEWVHSGMRLKLVQVKYLLDRLPKAASVSITSADHLTRELFTHAGCGTLIRKGEKFVTETRLNGDQQRELRKLLEQCFGRTLRQDYFETLELQRLIWADSHRAAAVITAGHCGAAYMDKFAVTPGGQGEGLGAALWQQVRSRHPKIYWRSRLSNPINDWYHRKAHISLRCEGWRVFARGLELSELEACAADALDRPESWRDEVGA
jgi:acetylglutamate kinase